MHEFEMVFPARLAKELNLPPAEPVNHWNWKAVLGPAIPFPAVPGWVHELLQVLLGFGRGECYRGTQLCAGRIPNTLS